jgi:hypothetical protein
LSKIEILIVDQKYDSPLENVFLSLSAGKNRQTGSSNKEGEFKFGKLSAQKFYLTALLKEYEFEFDSQVGKDGSIVIKDGEHLSIKIKGKRVSFSAYGKV